MTNPPIEWQCAYCGDWKAVQVLARDCEAKHEREAKEWADTAQTSPTSTNN